MVVLAVTSCVTPYQRVDHPGVDAERIGDGSYALSTEVEAHTSAATAIAAQYRRAGELCPQGFDVRDHLGWQVVIVRCRRAAREADAPTIEAPTAPAPTAPAPVGKPPNWWCASGANGAGLCERELARCDLYRRGMVAAGHEISACAPAESAFCFAEVSRGTTVMACTTWEAGSRIWQEFLGANPAAAGTAASEYEERR